MAEDFDSLLVAERAKWNKLEEQEEEHYEKEDATFVRPRKLPKICCNLSTISKHWQTVTGNMMNSQAPTEIISPRDLFKLKCHALPLPLSSICTKFIQDIKNKWGGEHFFGDSEEECCTLDLVIEHFGGSEEGFANLVAGKYLKFLICKCVETISFNKAYAQETDTIQLWKEWCQPTKLVDVFWHAHKLSPKQYAHNCNTLIANLLGNTKDSIDNIIDHDARYISFNYYVGSDYESKKDLLFHFEKQLLREDYYFGRFGVHRSNMGYTLFSDFFNVREAVTEIWEDMWGPDICG